MVLDRKTYNIDARLELLEDRVKESSERENTCRIATLIAWIGVGVFTLILFILPYSHNMLVKLIAVDIFLATTAILSWMCWVQEGNRCYHLFNLIYLKRQFEKGDNK